MYLVSDTLRSLPGVKPTSKPDTWDFEFQYLQVDIPDAYTLDRQSSIGYIADILFEKVQNDILSGSFDDSLLSQRILGMVSATYQQGLLTYTGEDGRRKTMHIGDDPTLPHAMIPIQVSADAGPPRFVPIRCSNDYSLDNVGKDHISIPRPINDPEAHWIMAKDDKFEQMCTMISEVDILEMSESQTVADVKEVLFNKITRKVLRKTHRLVKGYVQKDGVMFIEGQDVDDEWWGKEIDDYISWQTTCSTPHNPAMHHFLPPPKYIGEALWVCSDDTIFVKCPHGWMLSVSLLEKDGNVTIPDSCPKETGDKIKAEFTFYNSMYDKEVL